MAFDTQIGDLWSSPDYQKLKAKLRYINNITGHMDRHLITPFLKDLKNHIVDGIIVGYLPHAPYWEPNKGGYAKWKGHTQPLFRTGDYAGNIVIKRGGQSGTIRRMGLGFRRGAYRTLADYLEFGGVKWEHGDVALNKPFPPPEHIIGRPHWQPTWEYGMAKFPKDLREYGNRFVRRK
jgi:hypothetical protein